VPSGVSTRGAMPDPWRVMHVFVPDAFLRRTLDEAGVTRPFEMVPLKPIVDPVISRLATTIAREISSPDAFGRMALDAAGVQVGLELLRRFSSAGQIPDAQLQLSGWQLRQALDFMQAHLMDDVRLADVAGASGLSMYHFCRAFKASTGMPPQHYLRSLRMRKAEEMLAGGRAPVGQTAAALGYHSAGAFARAFKRETGFSPRAFRHRQP
jgi:AraC family transcriptional regulator